MESLPAGLPVGWALVFVMRGLKQRCSDRLGFAGVNTSYERLINQHNRVGQISSSREIITILLACICRVRRLDAPLPRQRHEIFDYTDRRDSPCGCPLSAIADIKL